MSSGGSNSESPLRGNRTSLLSSSISRDLNLAGAGQSTRTSLDVSSSRPPSAGPEQLSRSNSPALLGPGSASRKTSRGTPVRVPARAGDDESVSRSLSRSIPVRAGTPSKMGFKGEDLDDQDMPLSYSRRTAKKSVDFPAAFTPHDEPPVAVSSFKQQLVGSFNKSRSSPRIPSTDMVGRTSPRVSSDLFGSPTFRNRDPTRVGSMTLSASVPRDVLIQGAGREVGAGQLKKILDSHLVTHDELNRVTKGGLVQEPGEDMDDVPTGLGISSPPLDIGSSVHHQLAGGAIVDDIYKYVAASSYQNSQSFVGASGSFGGRATPMGSERAPTPSTHHRRLSAPELPPADTISPEVTVRDMLAPGGMRRAFLLRRAQAEGGRPAKIHTRNFIEFLSLYGHFGMLDPDDQSYYGSDDEEEEDIPGVEWRIDELGHRRRRYQSGLSIIIDSGREHYYEDAEGKILPSGLFDESEPLLGLKKDHGTSPSSTFFILLKAFVGTGILFLPKAFSNGGLAFSLVGMVVMGLVSCFTMLTLFYASQAVGVIGGAGYGDVAEILFGRGMRFFVLFSVVISQIGFGTAYMIFIAQNIINVIWTLAEYCTAVQLLIITQVAIYIPIIWIRKLGGFALLSLVANVFIVTGVVYVCTRDVQMIQKEGPAWREGGKGMHLGFGVSPPTFAGTAIFAYEGISLILPIANSMKNSNKFPLVLSLVMIVIAAMMILVGSLSYIAFGDQVTTVIFNAMPAGDPLVSIVQLLYAMAIFFSFPLSVYPCIRIVESWIFGTHGGKQNLRIKWLKNLFRAVFVVGMGFVAFVGSNNLDYFVSLVGSATCIPLMFILPAAFDLKLTDKTWRKVADVLLLIFGTFAFFYITWRNIIEWVEASGNAPSAPICPR